MPRRWVVAPRAPKEVLSSLSSFGYHALVAQLLHNRGVLEEARDFLRADVSEGCLADPWLLKDMDKAVERILRAVRDGETIAIYGDYDADGVTSAALLTEAISTLNGLTITRLPHRTRDGYGLNQEVVQELSGRGAGLLITVDCGVSDVEPIAFARSVGLDVVVVDHHRVPALLPDASAIINPRQQGCQFPHKDLAAVGLAFKLAQALFQKTEDGRQRTENGWGRSNGDLASGFQILASWLDLVALGTIADVAPLAGENRVLVRLGIPVINRTERPGLRELIESAGVRPFSEGLRPSGVGLRQSCVDAGQVSWVLAPRLNAPGRMDDATLSYRLLTTRDPEEARELAQALESVNRDRQQQQMDALREARDTLLSLPSLPKLLVVASPFFAAGVVGLVAVRLVEEFCRPAIVIELGETESRGSCRSIEEFNITTALGECADLLGRFGGHSQAAGFSIANDNLDAFIQRIQGIAEVRLDDTALSPKLMIDAELTLSRVDWKLMQQIALLAPFGAGNPPPVFVTRGLRVAEVRPIVGRQTAASGTGEPPQHLKLRIWDGKQYRNAMIWGAAPRNGAAPAGPDLASGIPQRVDLVYSLVVNRWEGLESIELRVLDWRPAG